MIKHTMQEWADFLGSYIGITPERIAIFSHKPTLSDSGWSWEKQPGTAENQFELSSFFVRRYFDDKEIEKINEYDWRVLVEPHTEKQK